MTDVGFGELVVRMVLSLAIVLGLMFLAYVVLRRRQGFVGGGLPRPRLAPAGRLRSRGALKAVGNRTGLRVLGRLGVGRTSQVVAVQFAERVLLVGASEQAAPQVLAELDLATWREHVERDDDVVREAIVPGAVGRPTSIIDSLREATARRG